MRHRIAVRVIAALAVVATSLFAGAPAWADEPGFEVTIGRAPAAFTTGGTARTLTAVVSTDRGGRGNGGQDCRKVRWALQIRTEGVSLDQVRIARIENGGIFQTRSQVDADAAQVVDAEPDPGELCRGRTVTGRWDIGFTGPDNGTVSFSATAVDADGRVLSSAGATSRVASGVAATPSPTPSATAAPSPEPTDEATGDSAEEDGTGTPAGDATSEGAVALKPAAGTPSVLGPGLIIGAVLVFLGVGLLLRMRTRNRKNAAREAEPPTGFYTMPR